MRCNYKLIGSVVAASTAMVGFSGIAQAVPSFARQTGMACAACHTTFPALTQFGRDFKLNGFTMTGLKQIESQGGPGLPKLKINEIPALSMMIQTSYTYTKGAASGKTQDLQFPQEISLYYAGEISPHIGAFVQATQDYTGSGFAMDMSEVRYANHTKNTTYGFVINNVPGMSDIYQTTPVWGFPAAHGPAYNMPIIEMMMQNVGGVGAYAMIDNHFYVQGNVYKSMSGGDAAGPYIHSWNDPEGTNTGKIKGLAPYWRLAYQTNFGPNFLEVGTYGILADLIPGANTFGATDKYQDVALDAQWERPLGDNSIVVRTAYTHQNVDLDATAPGTSAKLKVFKINGSYHFGSSKAVLLGYLHTSGDPVGAKPGMVANTGTTAYILQGNYYPWENVRMSLQYTGYTKFHGTSYKASDNNTMYLLGWFMF